MAAEANENLYPYKVSEDQLSQQIARHPVVIVGAGPVGLAAAIDLAIHDIPVVVLDENTHVCRGSRAICYSRHSLEILGRMGCDKAVLDLGSHWNIGRDLRRDRTINQLEFSSGKDRKYPAFTNLRQSYLERILFDRLAGLQKQGKDIQIRGGNKVIEITMANTHSEIEIETPDGTYALKADWLIAADGSDSDIRKMLNLGFYGRTFFDHFLICDISTTEEYPDERWFWFDPPFNQGRSAILLKQKDNGLRIEYQLGFDTDKIEEARPERIEKNIRHLLGEDVDFIVDSASVYTYQCRHLGSFKHNRVIFVGDSAHQVPPFGARGANSGFQDIDNLIWKLHLVITGTAQECLIDTYNEERGQAARENFESSVRSADFIIPKSKISGSYREAVLGLSRQCVFAKQMVNSGRQSEPCTYDQSSLNGPDKKGLPKGLRPGAPMIDLPLSNGWLSDISSHNFHILAFGIDTPELLGVSGMMVEITQIHVEEPSVSETYLGEANKAVYLLRPDGHVAARWGEYDPHAIQQVINRFMDQNQEAS